MDSPGRPAKTVEGSRFEVASLLAMIGSAAHYAGGYWSGVEWDWEQYDRYSGAKG